MYRCLGLVCLLLLATQLKSENPDSLRILAWKAVTAKEKFQRWLLFLNTGQPTIWIRPFIIPTSCSNMPLIIKMLMGITRDAITWFQHSMRQTEGKKLLFRRKKLLRISIKKNTLHIRLTSWFWLLKKAGYLVTTKRRSNILGRLPIAGIFRIWTIWRPIFSAGWLLSGSR